MIKNTREQGAERWIVGGTIEMSDGTHLVLGSSNLEERLNVKLTASIAETQADSTAATIEELKADFNALLLKLITAGIMAEAE